ncbi:MAG: hypothetical protein V2A73_14875, partial [Pseudomonadota bacterium]
MASINRIFAPLLVVVAAVAGCSDDSLQTGNPGHLGLRPQFVEKHVSALEAPSRDDKTLASRYSDDGACSGWILDYSDEDKDAGTFSYRWICPDGGNVEAMEVSGVNLGDSSTCQLVYHLREGGAIRWQFKNDPSAKPELKAIGYSSLGETFEGYYARFPTGSDLGARETWDLLDGQYRLEGTYDERARYRGKIVFEDPNTAASPDWQLDQQYDTDGNITQIGERTLGDGGRLALSVTLFVDGGIDYTFTVDYADTIEEPDIV